MKKLIIVTAAMALALATLPAADPKPGTGAQKKQTELFPDKVIAKGKGFEIKDSELEESFIAYKASLAANRQGLPEEKRDTTEAQLLDRLILTKMLLLKATDVDKKRAKETVETFIARAKAQSEEKFVQQLKAAGMTVAEFRTRMDEQATCEEVIERDLKATIKVSDERVKKWYDEHPERFQHPERVRTSHILISTLDKETQQPLSAAQKKVKEDQAKKLKIIAERGGDFAALAKQNSDDTGSRDKGGELTPFGRGDMGVAEYEAAAFSMKTNQISDLVETKYGYHIIKLLEKLPAKKVGLADVAERIKTAMVDDELRDQMPGYFDNLKLEFKVEVVDAKLRAKVDEVNGITKTAAPPAVKK